MHIKTHLENALYHSSLQSNLSTLEKLFNAETRAGYIHCIVIHCIGLYFGNQFFTSLPSRGCTRKKGCYW